VHHLLNHLEVELRHAIVPRHEKLSNLCPLPLDIFVDLSFCWVSEFILDILLYISNGGYVANAMEELFVVTIDWIYEILFILWSFVHLLKERL
jgi:hypothetical protein